MQAHHLYGDVKSVSLTDVPNVLIATDSAAVAAEVTSVLHGPDYNVRVVDSGSQVLPLANEWTPDIAILDLQIGNMGGIAISLDFRLEESGDRLPYVPVLLMLDRRADVFMARRSRADGWVIKPLDPIRLRKAIKAVLAGERYEDTSYAPTATVPTS